MKQRTKSLPLLVVIAVLALVLGSFGTATAAGLTKKKVKSIATKVVKKQAPSLRVAHAATAGSAGNATLLNGQQPSAYQNAAYRYRLPAFATTTSRTFTFNGLPAGSYLVDYNLIFGSGATGLFCYFPVAGATGEGFQYATTGTMYPTVNGSAVLTVGALAPTMICGGANFSSYNLTDVTSSVQFLKLDSVSGGLTAVGPTAGPAGAPGSATN